MRPITFQLLRAIADGGFHSGAALARALAVSRASVWHAVNDAVQAGVAVERRHGLGYRLARPLDWLDTARIAGVAGASGLAVEVLDTCPSTNTVLLERAAAGAPGGSVLVAEWQTAGRGRLGRPWLAGLARSLTFSLLWRFRQGAAGLAGLSLAVGVAVVEGLARHGIEARLKWPNDLLWREAKLGGILIEMHGDMLGPSAAVIGIGLNVSLDPAERARIGQPVADATQAAGGAVDRTALLAAVLDSLAGALARFGEQGFAGFRGRWTALHAHAGRSVALAMPDGARVEGVAEGVDEHGALLVRVDGVVRRILSGDVSLRVSDDSGG